MKIEMALLGAAMLGGCISTPLNTAAFEQNALPFLKDGKCTREEVMLRLGEPSGQFESQRILTYRMYSDPVGKTGVVRKESLITDPQRPNWQQTMFSVVLVFDGATLTRHSVVAVK
jgi:hypothetical protein